MTNWDCGVYLSNHNYEGLKWRHFLTYDKSLWTNDGKNCVQTKKKGKIVFDYQDWPSMLEEQVLLDLVQLSKEKW